MKNIKLTSSQSFADIDKRHQLQMDLVAFQSYVVNEHNKGDFESEDAEEIQNVINLIDELA